MLENTCVITFANNPIHYKYQEQFHSLYGDKFGRQIAYKEEDIINSPFYNNNLQIFKYKKYFGYLLWKPYLIKKTLESIPEQYVLYCDSNLRFKDFGQFEAFFKDVISREEMFFTFHDNFINRAWTKRDAFIIMQADNERYWNAHQVWTPLVGFSKGTKSTSVLRDYLASCRVPEVITEEPNKFGDNLPEFIEHRWEQSVLSILAERYEVRGISDSIVSKIATKIYSDELNRMKEEVNKDVQAIRDMPDTNII